MEDPDYAEDDEERKLRTRRIGFYFRNGCFETGVRVRCFGVELILLKMGNTELEKQECWEMYSSFYRAVLPKDMYDENIELLGYTDENT